ncbi:(deoxy)nucleoside triphosphate pyrophosphohydrolase [Erysipelothrix aquatica]|uniref:(deoxy)nucleoside triphosphate pyrophosphohydrolase n=1 Tax=Erysipelothrix aquatica TaxID=2683714 RepID=UPI0013572049|nr:(deoxy)nucleoside triphosphate pyrophosphohydrolase [Erysipelothrix aquatica]
MKSVEVVAAAIVKDDHILIAKRGSGEFEGLWEFPGGKIEMGESQEIALKREIDEELNLMISDLNYIDTTFYDYPSFSLVMHLYSCTADTENIIKHVHSELLWIHYQQLDSVEWVPADIGLLKSVVDYLSKD